MEKGNLCAEGFEASIKEFASAQRDAHCEYCGGQPCAGGTDLLAISMGVQKLKFMCMPCSMEHNRYLQEHLRQDATGLSQQEQLSFLRKLQEDADRHMTRWFQREVRDRGAPFLKKFRTWLSGRRQGCLFSLSPTFSRKCRRFENCPRPYREADPDRPRMFTG